MFSFVNLWELSNHTLFDDIELPSVTVDKDDGSSETYTVDKDTLINSIFDEVAEFEPITIDVDLMKSRINNFFKKNKVSFEHLFKINYLSYDPIENYDRKSEQTTITEREGSSKENGTTSLTNNGSKTGKIENGGTTTTTDEVSAFNSSSYQPKNKQSTELDTTINNSETNTNTESGSNINARENKDSGTTKFVDRTHGNIGITTAQDMMTEERDFWMTFNIYDVIAEKFLFWLCITTL